jgi:hypothetical protein
MLFSPIFSFENENWKTLRVLGQPAGREELAGHQCFKTLEGGGLVT